MLKSPVISSNYSFMLLSPKEIEGSDGGWTDKEGHFYQQVIIALSVQDIKRKNYGWYGHH